MEQEALVEKITDCIYKDGDIDVVTSDAEKIAFILDNLDITVPQTNRFFVETNARGVQSAVVSRRMQPLIATLKTQVYQDGFDTRAYTGGADFSHTSPFWQDILHLGIYGLRERVLGQAHRENLSKNQERFFQAELTVYDAALRFIQRVGKAAEAAGKTEMAENLFALSRAKPNTFFQRLQTVFIFYTLQQNVEHTLVRTLGRLDSLLYPYFQQEDEAVALKMIEDFIKEIDTLRAPANIPFAIGGVDKDGNGLFNPLSDILLDTYGRLNTNNTKMHILYNQHTPNGLIRRAFEYIRAGKNSIVFISDDTAIEGLKLLGAKHEDACSYHVVGCYECGAEGELTCSCNARVNIPKALEITLNDGVDVFTGIRLVEKRDLAFESFEKLYEAFSQTLLLFAQRAMDVTNAWEQKYPLIHSSPFLSSTYPTALERGGDLYCNYTAKYNNSSLNALGLATAVDSLLAIERLVYTEKKFTLSEFLEILKSDWENNEILRLRIKNNYAKYGTGNAHADELAKRIIQDLSANINGKKNAKGGVWRLGTFSIDWRWDFGKHTHATADGRKAGETLSQNTSASFGADKEGATAHLLSVSAFPHTLTPNGSIADIDLHASAVSGENGITALCASLKTYFARKGLAVHYNVLDTATLKKARENPSAYPNLQVRLCGWNVLFSSLSDLEKDEFIARSIKEE